MLEGVMKPSLCHTVRIIKGLETDCFLPFNIANRPLLDLKLLSQGQINSLEQVSGWIHSLYHKPAESDI